MRIDVTCTEWIEVTCFSPAKAARSGQRSEGNFKYLLFLMARPVQY